MTDDLEGVISSAAREIFFNYQSAQVNHYRFSVVLENAYNTVRGSIDEIAILFGYFCLNLGLAWHSC
jgi:hypothetical protein